MKQLLSNLLGSTVSATDGTAGVVRDFYFDDQHWILRSLVCERVADGEKQSFLVPSTYFRPREWDLPVFSVGLTREQIATCPDPESDRPVSKQKAYALAESIGWPEAGGIGSPGFLFQYSEKSGSEKPGDPHLRSFRVVSRYRVASDQKVVGRIKDFVVDDCGWGIDGLLIRVGPWYHRNLVMVSPHWAKEIHWAEGTIWTDTHLVDWHQAPAFSIRQRPGTSFTPGPA